MEEKLEKQRETEKREDIGQQEETERKEETEKEEKKINSQREVLEAAMLAGHILLENGAEIFRVEETMDRICGYYGVHSESAFVLSNGIFTTAGNQNEQLFAKVAHIPVKGAQLQKVAAVNQLSREIVKGKYTLDEVMEKLNQIRSMPDKPKHMQVLASGLGSASFCFLFGGSLADSAAAFVTGCLLYLYVIYVSAPHLSKIVGNIGGGALVCLLCILEATIIPGLHLNFMVIGSVMPLIPGVAFTNGIRDIADGDYIAGTVRLLDALLVFLSIAAGVGFIINLYDKLAGGMLL